MKKAILLISVILTINPNTFSTSDGDLNTKQDFQNHKKLKEKLEHILILDQGIRHLLEGNLTNQEKENLLVKMKLPIETSKKDYYSLMREIDSSNLLEVENIIKKIGYPTKEMVGEPANETVFYVIQHSNKIEKYLPLIRKAAKNGDISFTKLILMEDRFLMNKGKEQIYGSQIRGLESKNGTWVYFVWPIKNPDSVNLLRKRIGLEPIEEYAKKFDVIYKVITLKEVNEL